jgi:hypothetical protein
MKGVPVVIGETPASAANALVGSWHVEDFRITSKGIISGRFELELDRPINLPISADVLCVQVTSQYIWPEYGDTMSKPAGEFIPVFASQSTDTSAIFDLQGSFDVPPSEIDIDGGMPLHKLQITLVWYRVNRVNEGGGMTGYAVKVGYPVNLEQSHRGNMLMDQDPISLNGTLDSNVRGGLEYPQWLVENLSLPIGTPTMYPSPLKPPKPTFLTSPISHN